MSFNGIFWSSQHQPPAVFRCQRFEHFTHSKTLLNRPARHGNTFAVQSKAKYAIVLAAEYFNAIDFLQWNLFLELENVFTELFSEETIFFCQSKKFVRWWLFHFVLILCCFEFEYSIDSNKLEHKID